MLVALIGRDKPGAIATRKENRDAHLAYIEDTGHVLMAGPLIEEEEMVGSLVILEVTDMEAAEKWAEDDPYAKAGLFESVELTEWKKVIG
ncbi:YciI family protein [Roseivivax marinus]|uniref:YciI family protein n=1 Tax=Roseivivax marinus TaxID=1379903 RepID=UPI001F05041F|nr:YciI family protein [Roseivivax marinus]UMA64610.1 YciI family protein [Roseivivax marinus]